VGQVELLVGIDVSFFVDVIVADGLVSEEERRGRKRERGQNRDPRREDEFELQLCYVDEEGRGGGTTRSSEVFEQSRTTRKRSEKENSAEEEAKGGSSIGKLRLSSPPLPPSLAPAVPLSLQENDLSPLR